MLTPRKCSRKIDKKKVKNMFNKKNKENIAKK